MDFIDTHQHLIFRDRIGYGWTAGIPALAKGDFTPTDYAALTHGTGITGSIFMETGVDDADYQTEARLIALGQGRDSGGPAIADPVAKDQVLVGVDEIHGASFRGANQVSGCATLVDLLFINGLLRGILPFVYF